MCVAFIVLRRNGHGGFKREIEREWSRKGRLGVTFGDRCIRVNGCRRNIT